MASKIDVANLALDALGVRPIDTFDDDSDEARLVKRTFELLTRGVLRAHPWNFACKRVKISASADDPDQWKYENSYELPGDHIRVLEVDDEDPETYPWEVEGTQIVTDLSSPISIRYIRDVLDEPGIWDDGFVVALAKACAAAWAEPLVKAGTVSDAMERRALQSQRSARSSDGQEGTVKKIDNASWLEAR